jgi:hypothetical protein
MTQALYAHMNNKKKEKKSSLTQIYTISLPNPLVPYPQVQPTKDQKIMKTIISTLNMCRLCHYSLNNNDFVITH